ncbi:MAG: hypothetical protein J1F22_07880 [Lachnospiraceae bacterium]|nr:hypothetical protein [Lachnospiraceae bacterium]
MAGSKYGASLWLSQLLPTLLPFFIAIRLFDTCLPRIASRRVFLLTGLLCGYPAGAALVMNQYEKGLLSVRQTYFFLGFVNNPSPMFVLVFCGSQILKLKQEEAFLLFLILTLSSLMGSFLFSLLFRGRQTMAKPAFSAPLSPVPADSKPEVSTLSVQLDNIILDSFLVLIKIGGYVISFSILGQFIQKLLPSGSVSAILLSGSLEITSGISFLQTAPLSDMIKKVLTMIILTFGGISAAAQTGSILSKSELSLFPYLLCKGLNSLFAGLLSLFLFRMF